VVEQERRTAVTLMGGGGGVQERCRYLVTALMTGVDCAASDIPCAMSGCSRRADWGMQSYRRCGRHYAMNGTDQDRTEFLHLSLPAEPTQLPALRQQVRRYVASLPMPPQRLSETVLAVDEAAANAVQHAYAPGQHGSIELTIWTEPDALCIQVCDHGHWCQPHPDVDRPVGGLGITLMHRLFDGVFIEHGRGGTRVLLRQPIDAEDRDQPPRRRSWARGRHRRRRRSTQDLGSPD
jgi:anti-sigma regulatory factor (Ser/Thr protein kinase)